MSPANNETLRNRAAAYVRMSTDHQQYSTINQMDFIREDARHRGLEIVKMFSDEGKSGLNFEGRDALKAMIAEIEAGQANYCCILVYDVSRGGRYQDPDESAHYEYICRKAGVAVHYCAEPFENDGSPMSALVKSFKRAMAGEYSRELSNKVFDGACRLIRMGYRQGGVPGYGFRRLLIDQNGRPKGILQKGERKSLQTDRVIIVPGPEEEIKVVHWIYQMFIDEGKSEREIARILNEHGIKPDHHPCWIWSKVQAILTDEKYIGNSLYSRSTMKLKCRHHLNPPEKWVRAEGVFEGIVDRQRFNQAREIIQARRRKYDPEEMLARLRELLRQHGYLTAKLINQNDDMSRAGYFIHRFGNLISVYRMLGFKTRLRESHTPLSRRLAAATHELAASLVRRIEEAGGFARWQRMERMLLVNDELRVNLFIIRCSLSNFGTSRWLIRLRRELKPDISVLVRMDSKNQAVKDYYLLPSLDTPWVDNQLGENNGIYFDAYRFPSLDFLIGMATRTKLPKTYE